MIVDLTVVVFDHLNFVAPIPLSCTGVEKSSVFVTFKSHLNFAPLLPEKDLSL
jgi:hypothetical protein